MSASILTWAAARSKRQTGTANEIRMFWNAYRGVYKRQDDGMDKEDKEQPTTTVRVRTATFRNVHAYTGLVHE